MKMTTFGDRLKQARKSAGLTQEEAAKGAMLSQSVLSELELGKYKSSRSTIKLAVLYGVSASWLADGLGEIKPPVASTSLSETEWPFESISISSIRSLTVDQRSLLEQHIKLILQGMSTAQ